MKRILLAVAGIGMLVGGAIPSLAGPAMNRPASGANAYDGLVTNVDCAGLGAGGGQDCPLDNGYLNDPGPIYRPPVVNPPVVNPPRPHNPRPDRDYYNPRPDRNYYRPDRYPGGYSNDDYYYSDRSVPTYRYVEPRYKYVEPRYKQRRQRVQRYELSAAHVDWCYARYKTYRASDNSYKASRNGPRRECVSPYS